MAESSGKCWKTSAGKRNRRRNWEGQPPDLWWVVFRLDRVPNVCKGLLRSPGHANIEEAVGMSVGRKI
ncbi:unnamed protein product [Victoria cruziana]